LIAQKNIFNSAYTGEKDGDSHQNTPKNASPLKKTDLAVTLIGTVVGPSQSSFAIIEDPKTRKQELFRVDDMIQDQARVIAISRCSIVVLRGGSEEILECPEPETRKTAAAPPVRNLRSLARKESFGVKKVSEDAYMVDEAEVVNAMSNLNQLLTQVRLGPNFTDGKPDGFKLLGMARESIFAKAGLEDGDVIRKVNGLDISSADKAFQAFQELQNEKNFSVEISRGGETKSLSYEIR
jgi:general secretion pathway protein C